MSETYGSPSPQKNSGSKQGRTRFTPAEDSKLKSLFMSGQFKTWEEIAQNMPGKTARQCRDRWQYCISPDISNEPWKPEEDALILQKVKELGHKWALISTLFRGRSDVAIRNRYNHALKNLPENEQNSLLMPTMLSNSDHLSLPHVSSMGETQGDRQIHSTARRKMYLVSNRTDQVVQTEQSAFTDKIPVFPSNVHPTFLPFPVPIVIEDGQKPSIGSLIDGKSPPQLIEYLRSFLETIPSYVVQSESDIPALMNEDPVQH